MLAIVHCYVGDGVLHRWLVRQSDAFIVGELLKLGNRLISHPNHHKVVCNALRPPFHWYRGWTQLRGDVSRTLSALQS